MQNRAELCNIAEVQLSHKFKVTGILLNSTSPGFEFSLKTFCDEIYRTSEIAQEAIMEAVLCSEGKLYYVYMTAGANRFLRIYYGRMNEYLAALEDSADS